METQNGVFFPTAKYPRLGVDHLHFVAKRLKKE
jgi:hypothetical protein